MDVMDAHRSRHYVEACLPGAMRFSSTVDSPPPEADTLPDAVNASAATAAAAAAARLENTSSSTSKTSGDGDDVDVSPRTIRMCRSMASDMFDACRSVKMMGFTTVEVETIRKYLLKVLLTLAT